MISVIRSIIKIRRQQINVLEEEVQKIEKAYEPYLKHSKHKMNIVSKSGHAFQVDISRKAIKRFGGFSHRDGTVFRDVSNIMPVFIMGVAREFEWEKEQSQKGQPVLWISIDCYGTQAFSINDASVLKKIIY